MLEPKQDELVVATIKKIMPYGAFCLLDEYPGKEAFVHISEVAPRWIKNIHEFLHEGQKVVARVWRVIPEKNQIDLSLKRVTEAEKKRKLEAVRRNKRAEKLFEMVQNKLNLTDPQKKQTLMALSSLYEGDLLLAFETALDGPEPLIEAGIEKTIANAIFEVSQKSIKKQKAETRATISLVSYEPNGVELIKKTFSSLTVSPHTEFSIHFLGSPRYQLKVKAPDFKHAEKSLDELILQIEKAIKGHDVLLSCQKEEGRKTT
ncbi:MAG: translation initiation factor IF-2 subunit alpha [Candidatus Anstonellales archaeon]